MPGLGKLVVETAAALDNPANTDWQATFATALATSASAMDTTGLPPDVQGDDEDADAMDQSRGKRKKGEASKTEPADEATLLATNSAAKATAPAPVAAAATAKADGSAGGGGPRL
jgi:hypothetical protein